MRRAATSCAALPGTADTILENVEEGVFQIPFQLTRATSPVRSILHKYRDLAPDLADACLIQLAEELNTGDILTLDRDFEFLSLAQESPLPFARATGLRQVSRSRGAVDSVAAGIENAAGPKSGTCATWVRGERRPVLGPG